MNNHQVTPASIPHPSTNYLTITPPIDNEELSDQITLLAGQINAANYRFLKLIAEFDRREAWGGYGIRSCAHWLNWKCGISMGPARERVRVARCLDGLPGINSAFSSGEISYSKVRAMTRVATDDNEDYLLMIARHGTAQHMELLLRKYQQVEKCQQIDSELDQYDAREVVYYQDENGMWIIHAKLPAEAGAVFVKAIDAVMEQKNVPAGTSVENVPAETFPQRRADALEALAEHYIATADKAGAGLTALAGHERCQLMLHMTANTLEVGSASGSVGVGVGVSGSGCGCDDDGEGAEHSHLEGRWIASHSAQRLACDASVVTVLEDGRGNVLNIGRRSRLISPALRRALTVRDSGCRFPGCCETRYVDAHHVQHWMNGGETSLDNLVTLCRYHHRELHRGSFQVMVAPKVDKSVGGNQWLFITGAGDPIETCFNPQFGQHVPAGTSARFLQKHWPLVDSKTAVSRWAGERMDMGMAVDGLLRGASEHSSW